MKLRYSVNVLGLWIALMSFAGIHARGAGFVQDRFVIGLWVPPQTAEDLPGRYREIADANFNLVIGNSAPDSRAQIELCRGAGLGALVAGDTAADKLPEGPACWGYLLTDEPDASHFAELGRRVEAIRRARPGRLAYINLFPNYASPEQLGSTTYEEHVSRFIQVVRPDVLSMDHYPVMRPDRDTRSAYLANLEAFHRHAKAAGIPFWNYFNAMPYGPHTDPTEAQLRWQVNASVAWGARGVMYFCYWTPGKGAGGAGEFPKGGAVITAEGMKTRHYEEAKRINSGLLRHGPTLMQLDAEGAAVVHLTVATNNVPTGSPLKAAALQSGDPPADLLIGKFRHRDGRRAVWVMNQSLAYSVWPTLVFDAPADRVREVDRSTGREIPPMDDSPELQGFQCSLDAGEGRLFLLP
jgi:hypothetical protein